MITTNDTSTSIRSEARTGEARCRYKKTRSSSQASRQTSVEQGRVQGWQGIAHQDQDRSSARQDWPIQTIDGAEKYQVCRQGDLPVDRRPSVQQAAVIREAIPTIRPGRRLDQPRAQWSRLCASDLVAGSRDNRPPNSSTKSPLAVMEHRQGWQEGQAEPVLAIWRSSPRTSRNWVYVEVDQDYATGKHQDRSPRTACRNQSARSGHYLAQQTIEKTTGAGFGQVTGSRATVSRSRALEPRSCPPPSAATRSVRALKTNERGIQ